MMNLSSAKCKTFYFFQFYWEIVYTHYENQRSENYSLRYSVIDCHPVRIVNAVLYALISVTQKRF